jgi:peptide/nickel transport system substrate-binding protein
VGLLAGAGLLAACGPAAPAAPATAPTPAPTAAAASAAKPAAAAPTTAAPAATGPVGAPVGAAAGPAKPGPAATRPFVMAAKLEAPTLDPNVSDGSYYRYPQRAMYEPLVVNKVGADGKLTLSPLLAERWDVAPDASSYTFYLRKGVKFTDGTGFNADSVKWTIDRMVTLKTSASGRLPALDSVTVVDPYTVRFNLTKPSAPFLSSMTTPLMMSMDTGKKNEKGGDWATAFFDANPVGTGPYKMDQWVRGQQISMVRNPDYWGSWDGNHLDKVVIRVVKEAATQRQLLETGDADYADGIGFDDLDALSAAPGVVIQKATQAEILNIGIHTQRAPFDNVKVRQAIAYAFDYDSYIKGVLNNRARQPLGAVPYGIWALDTTIKPYTRDLQKAKQLMQESGVGTVTYKPRIGTISAFGWYQPRQAQILQQNLKEIGIDATIQDFADAATFTAQIQDKEKGLDFFFYESIAALDDPDFELRRLFHSASAGPGGRNGSWYQNAEFDGLLDRAVALVDRAERQPLYNQIQKKLMDDVPAIWPASLDAYVTRRDAVQNWAYDPFSLGVPPYYDLWLSK